jgi:shikimate dehydrogenase
MSVLTLALIGQELSHSVSPQLHRELFVILRKKFGNKFSDCSYELLEIAEESGLAQWIKNASAHGYNGANITYPYKAQAFNLSNKHIGVSSFIDSANCLRFGSDEVEGTSTDGAGLLFSIIRKYPSFDLGRYHLVLIGAGDAARATIYSLCTKWMPLSLTIVNRSLARAEELAEFCISQAPGPTVRFMSISDYLHLPPEDHYRLIVQSTPIGQMNNPGNLFSGFAWHETDFAIDLIYNPAKTEFLQEASHGGAKTLNGTGMLIEQAGLSQVFWLTGLLPDSSPLSQSEYELLDYHLAQLLTL